MKGPYYGGEKIMELIWGHGSKFHVRRLGLDYTDLGFVCVFLLFLLCAQDITTPDTPIVIGKTNLG